jgi:hypothetical protein
MAYIEPVRRQVDNIFAAARVENNELLIPHYYGNVPRTGSGTGGGSVNWYGYRQGEYFPTGALGNLPETPLWSCTCGR